MIALKKSLVGNKKNRTFFIIRKHVSTASVKIIKINSIDKKMQLVEGKVFIFV